MTVDSGFRALDPEEAALREENAAVLAGLSGVVAGVAGGGAGDDGAPHPDLVARFGEVASAADLAAATFRGVPVALTKDGVIVATTAGQRELRVRLSAGEAAEVLLATPPDDADVEGWARLMAWPVDVPVAEAVPALAAVLRAAAQAVSPTRIRRTAPKPLR